VKISITQGELNTALQTIQKAVSSRSILPILSGILFVVEDGYLNLCSTDLELSMKYRLPISAEDADAAVLPARLMGDVVKNLPDAKVELDIDNKSGNVRITCGSSLFSLKAFSAEDFPKFPETKAEKTIKVPGKKISSAIRQVMKAVSKDETRPVLCGILTTIDKGRLKMVATDSYRLSINETAVDGAKADDMKVIIPARCMDEVSKICGDEDIEIGLAKNQVYFKMNDTVVVSRLIEGNFPPYQQLLPDNCETRVKLMKDDFLASLRRVSLLAQNNALIKIRIDKEKVQLSAMTADVGSADEALPAEVAGEGMEIAFNAQYLIDGLNSISEEQVYLELNNPLKPGLVRPAKAQDFIYLVMPVRIG